ncbi:MAG TPA: DUF4304 domain-containing protein [Pyrinomonadaceae bacterium]|nr:DUF4304 domain-containing protein [Pyrinomonadaceae bacterium]
MILRRLNPSFKENVEKMLSERGDPPPGPHPTKLIDELIKDYFAPILKDKGFRKSGANFWRDNVNVIDVLNIQKSQWNDAWKASFYINLGAYWKAFHRDQHTEFKSKFPREYDCTAFSRVLEPTVKTWSLQPNSDLSDVGIILTKTVQEVAFPWFEEMHSEVNILNHLQRQGIADNFEAWLNSRA